MTEKRSVLVVEDDLIQAMDLELALADAGHEVVGPACDAEDALSLLTQMAVDFAILDYNLGTSTSAAIAARLSEQAIPFVYLTGRPEAVLSDVSAPRARVFQKPYNQAEMLSHLQQYLAPSRNSHPES